MNRTIKISILVIITIFVTGPALFSRPVRNMDAIYSQPDGTTFSIKVKGDEWTRIRTTTDGCAIVKDDKGWWCYGIYDENGCLKSTGHIVGKPVPADIMTSSRNIPINILSRRASQYRAAANDKSKAMLSAMSKSSAATKGTPAVIHKRGLAVLAQFQDTKFTYTKDDFHNLLNQKDFNGTGSAKDYFEEQFGGNWEFTFDVSEIVTLPYNLKHYGENDPATQNDIRAAELIRDACRAADENIDFSLYDQDGDGEVDNVYIFVAGHDEAEHTDQTDLIWSHQWFILDGANIRLSCDNVIINRYACSSELSGSGNLCGIGTFCHEYCHTFGLPDFYDTNYDEDGAMAAGLWKKTSLMDGGSYNNDSATPPNFNCIERMLLGLSEPQPIQEGTSYSLAPIHHEGQFYILGSMEDEEYYLFECRSDKGWDKYIGGTGMLVYHIDLSRPELWKSNTLNNDPLHQCADLIEADKRSDDITYIERPYNNIKGIFYPQANSTSISPEDNPSYKWWNSGAPEISIIGITSYDDKITFSTINNKDMPMLPEVTGFTSIAYPDALFIRFKSANPLLTEKALLQWRKNGDKDFECVNLTQDSNGTYSYLIDNLQSGNTLYELQITLEYMGVSGNIYKESIMTKRASTVEWPYFQLLNGGNVNLEEGFIAHVVNATDAAEKEWFLDDEPLEISGRSLVFPQHSGTLKCMITWKNGEQDIIMKEIIIDRQ